MRGYHLIFDSETQRCKVYSFETHEKVFECEMHDAAVNGPGFDHFGRCPRGTYALAQRVSVHCPSMGEWFTPVLNVPGRAGIGIHGGGSDLPDPMAPKQGWENTHGCLRVQNADNAALTEILRGVAAVLTVEGP